MHTHITSHNAKNSQTIIVCTETKIENAKFGNPKTCCDGIYILRVYVCAELRTVNFDIGAMNLTYSKYIRVHRTFVGGWAIHNHFSRWMVDCLYVLFFPFSLCVLFILLKCCFSSNGVF